MRRLFLPLLVCALWLASLAGGGWVRADCVRACAEAVAMQADAGEAHSCCTKNTPQNATQNTGCPPAGCPKCQALAKALLAVAPAPDVPLFFDTACGRIEPVAMMADPACALPGRPWRWSLPPPGTLLALHCQLLL